MIIKDCRLESQPSKARAAATVVWEESERQPFELFFETDGAYSQDLSANPHAFLVACFVPAMEHGERRLCIDGQICPTLRAGVETAMRWLHAWYGPACTPLSIETRAGSPPLETSVGRRSASFLSGGIDSLATLRRNRLDYPLDHPWSIKDCLFVHGFDIGGTAHRGLEAETYRQAWESLQPIVADAQVELIPVSSNVRLLDDDVEFWTSKFFGAAVCSVAHVFSSRLSRISIASSLSIPKLHPLGSHPSLDPNYGSAELAVLHDGSHLSRLEKVELVAGWQVALDNLRVCTMNPPGLANCGRCEKCIRTMAELLAVDKLKDTEVFPEKDVPAELMESLVITQPGVDAMYRQLIGPFEAQGRKDLADIIRRKSAAFHRHLRWEEERDWKGVVKKIDRRFMGSSLFRTYAKIRGRP